ncbi:MAG: hypothetical protein ABR956_18565, partial [Terracidiphilus sp.]
RVGAVVFFTGAGNTGAQQASETIYGIGTGPQIAFFPAPVTISGPTLGGIELLNLRGLAVDGAGDLFISNHNNSAAAPVLEVPAGGGAVITIDPNVDGEELNGPDDLALDGAGDLFIADFGNYRVVEVPAGGGEAIVVDPTVNGKALSHTTGVAVDVAGDLFIADENNDRVVEVPAGGGAAVAIAPVVNGVPMSYASYVTVDGGGDLFITDSGNNRVLEVPAGGGAAIAIDPAVNGEGLNTPAGLAVDGEGDLFIADYYNIRLVEVPAGGGAATAFSTVVDGEIKPPWGLAINGAGDLFVADFDTDVVLDFQRAQPPALNFPTATVVHLTDTADGTQTVQVSNIGNQALNFTGLIYPADFLEAGGDPNACTSSTSLGPGQECDLPIEFTPEHAGALSEDVTLTDNTLNASGTQQSIAVSGTALGTPAQLTGPGTSSPLGATANFTWNAGSGVALYRLTLGNAWQGSNNVYDSGETTALFENNVPIPSNGVSLFATLYSLIGGAWQENYYTFTEGGSLALATLSPASPAVLSTTQTFTWTGSPGPSTYKLYLGTAWPASNNLYNSGETALTSATVTIPSYGVTVYATLFQLVNGAWHLSYSTYTEPGSPTLATLSPGNLSVLSTSQTFSWTGGLGPALYKLSLGTQGYDSTDLYNSGETTVTSATVTIPSHGAKVYGTLFQLLNGAWNVSHYTYTEP